MDGSPGDRPGAPVYVLAGPGPEEEVDLKAYLRILLGRRWFIAGFVTVCTLAAVVVSLLLTPVYKASALIAPVHPESTGGISSLVSQFGGLASLAGVNPAPSDDTDERIAILTSRAFTTGLVKDNDLLPELFPDQWDPARKAWKVPPEEVPTAWDAFRRFQDIRTVSTDPKTGLVTLSIEWGDPQLAARWVQLHIDAVNRHVQAEAIREAEDSIAYLMQQVERTPNVELRQTLYDLVEAQTKKAMLARVREDYAFKVIDPPVAPDRRDRPKRTVIVVLAFVASLLAAVCGAFVLEFLKGMREPRPPAPGEPGPAGP